MAVNLDHGSFLTLLDFTPHEVRFLPKLAADLKSAKYGGYEQQRLRGENIAIIFERRVSRGTRLKPGAIA